MNENDQIYALLAESIDHMKLTPTKKEFARAVMRFAIKYACARQAGFIMVPKDDPRVEDGEEEERRR